MNVSENVDFTETYPVHPIENCSNSLTPQNSAPTLTPQFCTADPQGHKTEISYTDAFSDGVNRNTFAYPTALTAPDQVGLANPQRSSRQYSYELGVITRTQSPSPNPAHSATGPAQTMTYDAAGRLTRVTNQFNSAYTRWEYPVSLGYVEKFSTLEEGQGEDYTVEFFDGAGRVRTVAGYLDGSAGGWRGQHLKYDVMGRVVEQTNLTEMDANWNPVGDDAAGWQWSKQTYDWQGRPLLTVNVDSTTREAIYGGCGCAGGEVVMLRDEVGRRQRLTHDVLGRLWKTEVLNWDESVYSTTTNTYNARDQVEKIVQQGGTSGTSQETTMEYDGHGRLWKRHVPEQDAGKVTTYTYYNDDTVQTVTDARGATSTFTYDNRHLVKSITYGVPAGVAATANLSFDYDPAGNRTQMIDGAGRVDYEYDSLSRLKSETRQFTGLPTSYTISYGYNLAGQLTSLTDPFGNRADYVRDRLGRVTAVTGTGYGDVLNGTTRTFAQLASGMKYRAWGALKELTNGNVPEKATFKLGYNSRQHLTRFPEHERTSIKRS